MSVVSALGQDLLALLAALEGRHEAAARLLGFTTRAYEQLGSREDQLPFDQGLPVTELERIPSAWASWALSISWPTVLSAMACIGPRAVSTLLRLLRDEKPELRWLNSEHNLSQSY
jgi:hypothetical protein